MSATIIAREQLLSVIERVERLDEEIKGINDDKKEIYAEAKANGFCTKTIKKIIGVRRKDAAQREEEDAIFDLYMHAIGMVPANARVQAHEKNSVRDSDAAAPPKGTSESLSLPAGGGKPEEAGNLSNSDGNNLPGGPAVSSAPTESASDEISASNTPEGRSGTAREAPSAGSGDDALQASSGIQSAAPFHSNAAPPPPVKNAADLPEAVEAVSGLSSNRVTATIADATAEEATPAPQPQASSATHTQPVRTSGKGDKLPIPPPKTHGINSFVRVDAPELPAHLRRGKDNRAAFQRTANLQENLA